MKHLITAALTLAPAAAMAHAEGHHHIHPHGVEYTIAGVIVAGAVGLFFWARR